MSSANSFVPDLIGMMKSGIDAEVVELQKKLAQVRAQKIQIRQLLFAVTQESQENIFL
nr:hypothetical protein MarFTME_379 [Marseillevirus futianmevirus]